MASSNSPQDMTFGRLSDYFLAKVRAGENPTIEQFAATYPHLAKEIRADFPALLLLEKTLGRDRSASAMPDTTSLQGFQIEEEIGRGAMGVVYRAYQTDTNRLVALKLIPIERDSGDDLVQRFELERRAMARLDHPNIVPVYAYGHDVQFAYLVMKYIEGTSLDKLLQERADHRARFLLAELRSDWQLFAHLASQIASGLHHMHELGLVHRDIKPANLILDANRVPWITDFGLAKIHDYSRTVSRTGDAVGTPRYMAPEQLRGVCDARSDIYSLGITLYELAAGRRLWTTPAARSTDAARTSLSPADLCAENPDVPEELAKIIVKSCEFSPDSRYQTCRELEIVLDRFAQGHKKADRRGPRRDTDEAFRQKQKRMYITVALAIATMLAGATGWMSYRRAHQAELAAAQAKARDAEIAAVRKSPTFVELLAETDEENLPQVLHEFVRGSIEESGEVLHLNDQEQNEILKHFDQVTERMSVPPPGSPPPVGPTKPVGIQRAAGPNVDSAERAPARPSAAEQAAMRAEHERHAKQFQQAYQRSTVPTAAAIIGLVRVVERSRIPAQEKKQGYQDIRLLAKLVVSRRIEENEAKAMVAQLQQKASSPASQPGNLVVPEPFLRDWLKRVHQRLAQIPNANNLPLELDGEIQDFLHHAFN